MKVVGTVEEPINARNQSAGIERLIDTLLRCKINIGCVNNLVLFVAFASLKRGFCMAKSWGTRI